MFFLQKNIKSDDAMAGIARVTWSSYGQVNHLGSVIMTTRFCRLLTTATATWS